LHKKASDIYLTFYKKEYYNGMRLE